MRTKYIALLIGILTACSLALADSNFALRMGSGQNHAEGSAIYSIGYEASLGRPFLYKLDAGAWSAGTKRGNLHSPYAAGLLGLRAGDFDGFNAQVLAGLAMVGNTDATLGSNFQFTEEVQVGYSVFGLGYKHISNAGIKKPNLGRDYIFLNLSFPLSF